MSEFSKEIEKLNNTKDPARNPALFVGTATSAIVTNVYFILDAVFPEIPDEVLDRSFIALAMVLPMVISFIIRDRVWSPRSVQMALKAASVLQSPQLHHITKQEDTDNPS